MYCSKCGNMIREGDAFCSCCGNRVENTAPLNGENGYNANYAQNPNYPIEAYKPKTNIKLIIIYAVVIIAALAILYTCYIKNRVYDVILDDLKPMDRDEIVKVFGKSDDVDGDDDGCLWYNENLTFYGIKVDSALCYEENYGIGNFVFWFEYSNKSKLQEMLDEYCTYSNSYGDYRNFSCGDTEITVNYGDGSENIYVNIITY